MRRILTSAAYRIAFTYSCGFALAIVLLGAVVYFAADADFRRQQDAGLVEESAELVADYRDEGMADLLETMSARQRGGDGNGYLYALFDPAGRWVAGALDTTKPRPGLGDIVFKDPVEGPDPARAYATILPGGRTLVVAVDPEALERIDRTILVLFAGAFVLVVALGSVGALLLGGFLRRRLGRISGTARAIVSGDLERRMPVGERGDEFDEVALALNAMLDRIAQLLDNLRQVSSDVAHDLRTPLARLRGQLEEALDGPRDVAAYRSALKQSLQRSDELLALFSAILRISEVEAGSLRRTFAAIDLSELVRDIGESYAPAIADGGRTLACDVEPGLTATGDRELVAQALINLLDNAQHHTPPGTRIELTAHPDGGDVAIRVADDGPGVDEGDLDRIARRFTRLDSSRSTPGNGLGLNLVAAIAAAHGGRVRFEDNRPGLRATLLLPRRPS